LLKTRTLFLNSEFNNLADFKTGLDETARRGEESRGRFRVISNRVHVYLPNILLNDESFNLTNRATERHKVIPGRDVGQRVVFAVGVRKRQMVGFGSPDFNRVPEIMGTISRINCMQSLKQINERRWPDVSI
jgi:hypothetical protein